MNKVRSQSEEHEAEVLHLQSQGPICPHACVLQSRGCGSAMTKAVGLDHRPGTRLEDQSICIYVASQPILGVGMVLLWED